MNPETRVTIPLEVQQQLKNILDRKIETEREKATKLLKQANFNLRLHNDLAFQASIKQSDICFGRWEMLLELKEELGLEED